MAPPYKLYYWPMMPGRGELIRLILELADVPYEDVARGPEGIPAVMKAKTELPGTMHYAVPIIQISETLSLSQTAVITAYLAKQHGLMPHGDKEYIAMQIDHTVNDIISEVHDTHHPVDKTIYYEGQLEESKKAAEATTKKRLPRLLDHLENCVKQHGGENGPFLFGTQVCYVDLSIAFVVKGIQYAFPKNFERHLSVRIPRVLALREAVEKIDRIAAYMKSERCVSFSNGIFRYYPELDT